MRISQRSCGLALISLVALLWPPHLLAEDAPTPANPPPVFQPNETRHGFADYDSVPDFFGDDVPAPYDTYSDSPNIPSMDHKPEGLFHNLQFAEDVDLDRTIRKGHIHIPVNPTETFPADAQGIYLVFSVFKHYSPYEIIGRVFPEQVEGADPLRWIDEDRAELATEDESGYLKFFASKGNWKPGRYRVDIYVGYMVNAQNKMGVMRFTVQGSENAPPKS